MTRQAKPDEIDLKFSEIYLEVPLECFLESLIHHPGESQPTNP